MFQDALKHSPHRADFVGVNRDLSRPAKAGGKFPMGLF
jgi:hypothetical protein